MVTFCHFCFLISKTYAHNWLRQYIGEAYLILVNCSFLKIPIQQEVIYLHIVVTFLLTMTWLLSVEKVADATYSCSHSWFLNE